MLIIWLLVALVVLFSLSGLSLGAPYMPTLKKQIDSALKLANLNKGQTLIELGCGDGRILVEAAKRGINCIGYEINPMLALISIIRTRRYRKQVSIIIADYWREDWPKADAVFVFLIKRYMPKLDERLKAYPHKPVKLISYAFQMPDKPAERELNSVYLYRYKEDQR